MSRTQAWKRLVISIAMPMLLVPALGQKSQIKHWDLGFITTDADLSPDDSLLAVTLELPSVHQKVREPIIESLEVWDYKQKIKLGSIQLSTYLKLKPTYNAVRFTADGQLLVATEPTKLHVLDAASLRPIRVIDPPLAQSFRIRTLETSPNQHLAVVSADDMNSGELFAYDLDTGHLLFQWKSPYVLSSIAWKQDGTQFAVAAPFLCSRFRGTVHIFGTNPWLHLRTLAARNPVSLAFSEDRLYLVESSFCKGSMFDRHLGLEAFNLRDWNRQHTTYLPHRDIHSSVSFAQGRLLANTGKISTDHDWLDGTTWGVNVDAQVTIWEDDAGSILFNSSPLAMPRLSREVRLRLSRTGKMVLFNPQSPQVFVVP